LEQGDPYYLDTVIPRLTSDLANEFFSQRRFFRCFWTRLTNVLVDARANIKQSGHSRREVESTLDRFFTSSLAKSQSPATEEEETYLE